MYASTAWIRESTEGGVFRRSVDGGEWVKLAEGLPDDTDVHAITVPPTDPDVLYATLKVDGTMRSLDGGETWEDTSADLLAMAERPHLTNHLRTTVKAEGTLDGHVIKVSPASRSRDRSMYRSDDGGRNWRRFDHGVQDAATMMAVALHPRDADRVYCVSRVGQVFGTRDRGRNWSEHLLPETCQDVFCLAAG
jgi:photosystem II stability/assembly factor-like uncharacterized protein